MRKRNSPRSGNKGASGRSAGRSGARTNSSRGNSGRTRRFDTPKGDSDSRPKRPSRFSDSGDDSKKSFTRSPRGGKSFGRSKEGGEERTSRYPRKESGDFSRPTRGGKSFGRSKEGGEERTSRYPRKESGDFSRPTRGGKSFGRSKEGGEERSSRYPRKESGDFSKPARGGKSFGRKREGDERSSQFSRENKEGFSKSRTDREEGSFERKEKSAGKSGFFSKLSRGGKTIERKHDKDFGKSVKEYSEHKQDSSEASSDKIRLNKYIANSGVCSRREADELITMGLVTVNGQTITELGYKITRGDVVKYDGKTLKSEKPVYILMNKPKGYLTTTQDPQERNTVMHIIAGAVKERVYPVGRLDRNTTGLLLLTNDGDLTEKLSHPSYNVKKIYKVELDKPLTKADYQKILDGVMLEEGRAIVDDLAIVSDDGRTVGIELHIGWNRVVRRIFERLEYTVVKLDRTIYAGLDKKELPRGHWRFLTNEEIVRLKHYK